MPAGGCTHYTVKYNVLTTWGHSAAIGSNCVMGETSDHTDITFFTHMQQAFISERLLVQPDCGPVSIYAGLNHYSAGLQFNSIYFSFHRSITGYEPQGCRK
jgi:hypothetical protein